MPSRRLAVALLACGWLATARAAEPPGGMVVAAHRLAAEAGVEILRAGGNAVDAAVAVGYADAVVEPCCGNIGGGGFMLLHLANGGEHFLNFRETAPAAAGPAMYAAPAGGVDREASLHGYKAVAVPGTVLGLDTALARWGTLPRAQVMAPAIRLAQEGFVLTDTDTPLLVQFAGRFAADPVAAGVFLRPDGTPLRPGDRLRQPALASTLTAIAQDGPAAFYQGALPRAVEAASRAGDGVITAADFAAYRVTEPPPVRCTYRGYAVVSAPPPSSGGTALCEILNILSGYDLAALGFHTAASVHVMAEAMRHAYVDRNTALGDPDFVDNPVARLLSPAYAAAIRAQVAPAQVGESRMLAPGTPPHEREETTHYAVTDAAGNAASVTYTVNGAFGALVMAPGTGVLLNDEMDDFAIGGGANQWGLVQGRANAIAPGKRPLSSMAPTLVLQDGAPVMVLGSPGGARIITIVLETLLNLVDYGMDPQAAVDAPRLHHQWLPDVLEAEPGALAPEAAAGLRAMGYTVNEHKPWGAAEIIVIDPQRHRAAGAADPRRPGGVALGY